jgi:hypothetical protein
MGGRRDGWFSQKKGKITLSFTSPEKEFFIYIFMKSLHHRKKKRSTIHYLRHDPYLPSVPVSLQALVRVGCACDTDITLLPDYHKLDLARSHASILTSPHPLSRLSLETG